MKVAVIIPARNGATFLDPCLRALLCQQGATFSVIVVDNGSTDGGADLVASEFPVVQLIRSDRPLGFAGAANAGIRAALSVDVPPGAIVLLNQDTVVHAGWLAALLEPLARDPRSGVVGCKALFPNGHIQHAGAEILWPLGYGRNRGYDTRDDGQFDAEDSPSYVAFVGVALRSAMLDQVGLLDEGFNPAYFEDVDLCLRARAAGWGIAYAPRAVLTHHEGAAAAAGDYGYAALIERNRLRLALKHMSADQLLDELRPAEEAQLAERARGGVHALRRAYLDAMLMLPALAETSPWRERRDDVLALLSGLRRSAAAAERGASVVDDPGALTSPRLGHRAPAQTQGADTIGDPRPAQPPPVAIIILTWNGLNYTQECLASLRELTAGVEYQVIVVDNGSTDGTREYLRELGWITLIENETNEGFTRGNNRAIRAAPADYDILLLNNDTRIVQSDWLACLRAAAHSDPAYGVVGARLLMANGRLAHVGTYMLPDQLWGWQIGGDEEDIGQYPGVREVEGIVGACMYIRRDVIERVGVLDERFFSYYEDTDYCLRATEAGYKVVCSGDVRVIHYENVSTKLNRVNFWDMYGQSQAIFREKWEAHYRHRYTSRVLWHSLVSVPSGYATSSRQLVLAMDRLGVDVRLAYVLGSDYAERNSGDPRIEQLRQRPKDTTLPQVLYSQGDLFHKNSGRYRIGYTMLEIDGLPDDWVRQANMMDEVWAPSHFNVETFRASGVVRPIHVVPLGVDPNYFHPGIAGRRASDRYTFLSVFEWGERKAPELLLRAYTAAFSAEDDVLLLLKIDNRDAGVNVPQQIASLGLPPDGPKIALLYNQEMAAYQMGSLYRGADCFVLPTRGEGWGMPILEAMACGLPAIATDWSAQTEFMRPDIAYPLRVRGLAPAVARNPYYAGFSWADPDFDHLVHLLRHVYEHRDEASAVGCRAAAAVAREWTWDHAARRIIARLEMVQ